MIRLRVTDKKVPSKMELKMKKITGNTVMNSRTGGKIIRIMKV